jgi:hypothetical protein
MLNAQQCQEYIEKVLHNETLMSSYKDEIVKWVSLLESGNYRQCQHQLREAVNEKSYAHCCLGVACFVKSEFKPLLEPANDRSTWKEIHESDEFNVPNFLLQIESFNPVFIKYDANDDIELDHTAPADLNDQEGFSFAEIARVMKYNFPNWFHMGYRITKQTNPKNLSKNLAFGKMVNKALKDFKKHNSVVE